jgi:hypothetical protein
LKRGNGESGKRRIGEESWLIELIGLTELIGGDGEKSRRSEGEKKAHKPEDKC